MDLMEIEDASPSHNSSIDSVVLIRNPIIWSTIVEYLSVPALKKLRLTSVNWNRPFALTLQKKQRTIELRCTKYKNDGQSLQKFTDLMSNRHCRTDTDYQQIPFGNYRLILEEDSSTTTVLEFFSVCGGSIRKLVLVGQCRSQSGAGITLSILRRIVFEWTPQLERLELDVNIDNWQKNVSGDANAAPMWKQLPKLKALRLKVRGEDGGFVGDLFRAAVGLKTLKAEKLLCNPWTTNELALTTLSKFAPWLEGLQVLHLVNLRRSDLDILMKLANRVTRPLRLSSLTVALLFGEAPADEYVRVELFQQFLKTQACTLNTLNVHFGKKPPVVTHPAQFHKVINSEDESDGEPEAAEGDDGGGNIRQVELKFPKMVHLKRFELHFHRTPIREVSLHFEGGTLSTAAPNLCELLLYSNAKHRQQEGAVRGSSGWEQILRGLGVAPHNGVTELSLEGSEIKADAEDLAQLTTAFPLVIDLEIGVYQHQQSLETNLNMAAAFKTSWPAVDRLLISVATPPGNQCSRSGNCTRNNASSDLYDLYKVDEWLAGVRQEVSQSRCHSDSKTTRELMAIEKAAQLVAVQKTTDGEGEGSLLTARAPGTKLTRLRELVIDFSEANHYDMRELCSYLDLALGTDSIQRIVVDGFREEDKQNMDDPPAWGDVECQRVKRSTLWFENM